MILSSSAPRSSRVGSGKFSTVISFSSSVGISITGETRMMVLKLFFRWSAISLSLRMTAKLFLREKRMEILENENGRLDLFDHLVQRGQRVLGGGVAMFLGLNRGAGGNDAGAATPFENFLLARFGDLHDQVLHAHLFARDDVENRIAGAG